MSSLFRLFDWTMGTSSTLKGKRIAMNGTGGAFGAAVKKQLEADGVSEVTALRCGSTLMMQECQRRVSRHSQLSTY
jgi:hypothetical protein